MPNLAVLTGEDKGNSFTFEMEVIIGRSPDANLILKDLRSSRKHARVVKIDNNFYLEDLSSQNGTFLNGHRIKTSMLLKNHDNFRIGNTWFAFATEEESLVPGEYFLNYKICKEVSQEATGNMYLAIQTTLQRRVLLWALPFETLGKQADLARQNFCKKISNTASLFHRNIMMLMDFAVTQNYFYCAFEEVDFDSNIKNYLKLQSKVPLKLSLDIALQAARGLHYAHKQNILHLHLTSKNVLIQQIPGLSTRVVLTEFGVSRFLSEMTTGDFNTTTGIFGISEYIAPEQITGKEEESTASDIYSYGCFLYHLLSGNLPFQADSPFDLAKQHLTEIPRPLCEVRKDVPPQFSSLVSRCLEKSPAKRYTTFQEILYLLENLQDQKAYELILNEEKESLDSNISPLRFFYALLWIIIAIVLFFVFPFFN